MNRYERSREHYRSSRKSRERDRDSSSSRRHKGKYKSESPEYSRDKTKSKEKKKHRKQKKRRSSSSSSDSSSSSNSSTLLLQRLREERERQTEMRKKQKELLKASETAEEKRFRRLLKKEAKERKRKERMGWDNDYLHYTNTDNPFGDGNLLSTFVWAKKLDKEGLTNATREELEILNRQKQEENRKELEKVKKRRMERELERQQREDEMAEMQRSKEAAQFQEWERQEDQFHLEQARLRSSIRIQDGRAKPIDLLAKYIGSEAEIDAVEMHEPYAYLKGLSVKDLEDLLEDIAVYQQLERGANLDYWNDMTVIVEDELHKLRKVIVGRREGINPAVASEVTFIFRGKTASQLIDIKELIEKKLSQPEGVDIGYWESLLSQLKAHMARARLRDRHQENLKKKLEMLKAEQGVVIEKEEGSNKELEVKEENSEDAKEEESNLDEIEDAETSLLNEAFAAYDSGGYSPEYLSPSQLEPGTEILDEAEDEQRLQYARMRVSGQSGGSHSVEEPSAEEREARRNMGADEAQFSVESQLDTHVYLWSDKYRPRKPRYFNRVHTGFEWNKYNQTHYDMDNPPPKIVQGYKFNIFYPDLIDKGTTPEYFLTSCPDNKDFAILRFHAGPPYEDIAFKIVSREWEYSYKRGFRCQFHNNIFQLWFHFKRYRYRR